MNTLIVVAILLTINILLMHFDKVVKFYYFIYKSIKKPKFKLDELVLINNLEYQVVMIDRNAPFYTYFCISIYSNGRSGYFHESDICKKVGLLKELE
jgi:hypothetical protein